MFGLSFISSGQVADTVALVHSELPWVFAFMLFLLGTVFASFAGVCIDRLPHQLKWLEDAKENYTISHPRSSCNSCSRTLGLVDLIPVLGWLVNLGRCKSCKSSVPWIYPLSEAALGILFAASSLWFDEISEILSFCLLATCMFVITGVDYKHHWIPAVITTPLLWLGLLTSPFETEIIFRVLGAACGGGVVALVFWYYEKRTKMDIYAGGDVAFMMFMGAWIGAMHVFNYLLLAAAIFMVHAAWLRWKSGVVMVPWGPHLSLAAIIYILAMF